jgi:hypothetical protein
MCCPTSPGPAAVPPLPAILAGRLARGAGANGALRNGHGAAH